MSFKIFITGSGLAQEAQQLLKKEDCIYETGDPKDSPEDIARKLRQFDPDAIIVRQGNINSMVQEAAKSLKVICKHGVGTDNIDVAAATKRGIPVMYTPLANYESTAEHTLALMLSLARRIPFEDRRIRNGIFDKKQYEGIELFGKFLGLIGFGRIGRRLAELVAPFKMNVVVYHPSCKVENLPQYISKVERVEDLFAQADIVSIHCHLTPETANLINKQAIAQMKAGAYLINTARGGIVNETDLFQALIEKRISGAALDVLAVEPPVEDNPLFKLDNVILSPHVGGASDNSLRNMGSEAIKNVLAILNGSAFDMESLVNKEIVEIFSPDNTVTPLCN